MLDVLIPHYNDADQLDFSLRSVADQTWRGDLRVIVVDDGSDKDQLSRAEKVIIDSDLNIELIRCPENQGRPKARNTLLDASDARFVAWLDAGDVWYPTKLQTQFNRLYKLDYEGADLNSTWVTCNYDWQWTGRRRRTVKQDTTGNQLHDLFVGDRLRAYLWTLLGTRASFMMANRFDERLTRLQDLDYFISFVRGDGVLVSTDTAKPLCCYFKSDIGRNATEIRKCYTTIFDKHRAPLEALGPRFVRRAKAKADFVAARFAKSNGDRLRALSYHMDALRTDPYYVAHRVKKSLRKG